MEKRWIIEPDWPDRAQAARRWSVPPLVAQILHTRGVQLDDDARAFLSPQLTSLHPPAMLPGAVDAAARIVDAVRSGRGILLYGDYDVDGIMGIAILWHVLTGAGADVSYYVPHRVEEGYGLNIDAVRSACGTGHRTVAGSTPLIVSIDCGISAVEVAAELKLAGVSLIITDHHTPRATLPEADVIVHPTVGGQYPNPHLCGAGVAFKLAWAIAQQLSVECTENRQSGGCIKMHPTATTKVAPEFRELLRIMLPLAALGTIADVVPLTGENRVIAKCGLMDLPSTPLVGLRALIESAGLSGGRIDAYDVGFKLAPRLNAAGRMGHAKLAVELMTRADTDRARETARDLQEHNRKRQTVERRIAHEAADIVEASGMACDAKRGIVVASDKWHPGVIGIVASRLVERFGRPTIVISTQGGNGQGSARSVRALDLTAALSECESHLISFGGHSMAAGLRIAPERIDAFRSAFVQVVNNRLTPADMVPALRLDAEISIAELTLETVERIKAAGPFGAGNPKPRFATDWLELADEPRSVGRDRSHLQATFTQDGKTIKAIGFGMAWAIEDLKDHRRCKVAFEPIINEFNNRRTVEMQMADLKFP